MYSIELIGAMVVDTEGQPIGIVHSIEHHNEGVNVVIYTGEEEPKSKEPAPSHDTISKLHAVAATGGDK